MSTTHKVYFNIYDSAFQVFENHKIFGVGNKNYRVETCVKSNFLNKENKKNISVKIISSNLSGILPEHGIFGSFLILFILFKLFF